MRVHEPSGATRRLGGLLVCLCLSLAAVAVTWKAWDMFGPARRPMLQGWNDSFYYFWLPAVVINHDLDFAKPLATSGTIKPEARDAGLAQPLTPTGLLPNKYPPGWAVGSLPFFAVAHLFAPRGSTGFEPVYLVAVWAGQLLYAAGGLWLGVRIIRRLVPAAPALVMVLTVWLASPLIYYQTARVSLSHNQVFTLAMAVFWLTLRIRDGEARGWAWAALGFASALMIVTRNITIVYLAFPAWALRRELGSWRTTGWLLAGAALPIGVQIVAWRLLFGSWFAYSYGGERFDFAHLHIGEVLFSPWHGFFYWHPLLLVGMAGLAVWATRNPIGRTWVVSFVAITILNAAWPCWWFASSFGNRGFEVAIFFGMFGIAALYAATSGRPWLRGALMAAMSAAVVWNLVLFALFLTRRIPQEEPVTVHDNLRALLGWVAEIHVR